MRLVGILGAAFLAAAVLPAGLEAQPSGGASGATGPSLESPSAVPSDEEIFDSSAFDETVKKSRADEKKEAIAALVGGTILLDASATAPAPFDGYTATGSFSGKAFAKVAIPTYGQLYLAYNLQHTLFQGAGGSLSAVPVGSSLFANTYALSEFFFDFDIAKRLFVRVGNQLLAWGPSTVWTPVDFINLQRANLFTPIDLRVGKPGIKLFLPVPSLDFTLFGDFSDSVANGTVGDLSQTVKLAARVAATLAGFEFGVSGYFGRSLQNRYGFDLSGNLLGTTVYGELALLFPYGSYASSYAVSLGLSRTVGELKRWNLRGELFYNSSGTASSADYPALIAAGSFVPLYVGRMYAYGAVTKRELFTTSLDATLSGIGNISDGSYQAKLSSTLSIPGLLPFTVSLAYNGGGAGKEFTRISGSDALVLDLQVLAEF